jgi:hypothetical protein
VGNRHISDARLAGKGCVQTIGRQFYNTGPAQVVTSVRRYFEAKVAVGNLAIDDREVAAAQFLDS